MIFFRIQSGEADIIFQWFFLTMETASKRIVVVFFSQDSYIHKAMIHMRNIIYLGKL